MAATGRAMVSAAQRSHILGRRTCSVRTFTLNLEVTPFGALGRAERDGIDEEAEIMAMLRRADERAVTYSAPVLA